MGFALWIDLDERQAWAQGRHEYRPMGSAVIALNGQFRGADFAQTRSRPPHLAPKFAGFFGSLEELNATLRERTSWRLRFTPGHLL